MNKRQEMARERLMKAINKNFPKGENWAFSVVTWETKSGIVRINVKGVNKSGDSIYGEVSINKYGRITGTDIRTQKEVNGATECLRRGFLYVGWGGNEVYPVALMHEFDPQDKWAGNKDTDSDVQSF